MKLFAKAIDVFPWHLRKEKEKSTNTDVINHRIEILSEK